METYEQLQKKEYIEVYSIQGQYGFDCLKKREIYRPLLEKSYANESQKTKYAYKWMAVQFEKRNGRRQDPKHAFFWVFFDKEKLLLSDERNQNKKWVVTLQIPTCELLISLYRQWNYVLLGDLWNGTKWIPNLGEGEPSEINKQSWECIFNISKNCPLANLQGVLDRAEPGWIREISEVANKLLV